MRVTMPRVYPSNERERRVVRTKDLSVKQQQQKKVKTVIKQHQRSVHRMVGSGTREAQGRVRRGGLLDEGADCVCEVGFVKKAANASFQTDP